MNKAKVDGLIYTNSYNVFDAKCKLDDRTALHFDYILANQQNKLTHIAGNNKIKKLFYASSQLNQWYRTSACVMDTPFDCRRSTPHKSSSGGDGDGTSKPNKKIILNFIINTNIWHWSECDIMLNAFATPTDTISHPHNNEHAESIHFDIFRHAAEQFPPRLWPPTPRPPENATTIFIFTTCALACSLAKLQYSRLWVEAKIGKWQEDAWYVKF